jgi:hypothetical protein
MVVVKTIDLIQYCKLDFLFNEKGMLKVKRKRAKGKGKKAKGKVKRAKVKRQS